MSGRPCGLLEPGAATSGTPGSEGAPAQQCAGRYPTSSRTTSAAATAAPTRHRCRTGSSIGRERVRRILHSHDITFQRTRTWKESTDPAKDAKLDRIE